MRCPGCKGRSSVVDTEASSESVLRRRECYDCGNRWNTKEMVHNGWNTQRRIQVAKQQAPKQQALTKPAPEIDFRLPVSDDYSEDMHEVLREIGIDYEWQQDD